MIGSRLVNVFKTINQNKIGNSNFRKLQLQQIRHSGHGEVWEYRSITREAPKWARVWSTIVMSTTWFWIWWNVWHGWEHLIGYYEGKPLPDPLSFTDEELGIPPDDEDL